MDINQNSVQHLVYFIDKIKNKTPFAIIRPSDGEYLIMTNKHFSTQDDWSFNGGKLQQDLLDIKELKNGLDNFFIGLPCPGCQGSEIISWYKNTLSIDDNQITYANVFCNRNWNYFVDFLKTSKIPISYIGPGKNYSNDLNIYDIFNIDRLLVNTWDTSKDTFIRDIYQWVDNITKRYDFMTFMFSAGPISKYIIPILYRKYPTYQFIDVGSALDLPLKGSSNRSYILSNHRYNRTICSFKTGHVLITSEDISSFDGGWSYSKKEMSEFLKFIQISDSYKILEFGAGKSTRILYDLIERACYNIEYDTYEHDEKYKVVHKNVNTIMYKVDEMDNICTPDKKYDIIIIDGPHGLLRTKWYNKIKKNIKHDTILLIDDYNHYNEYQEELNKNFKYTILSRSDIPFSPNGEHSWRILTNLKNNPVLPENNSDITAVLNLYKRPHVLRQQIDSLRNQTVPPKEIIIWKNYAEGYNIPEDIKADKSLIIIDSSKNLGVWARFAISIMANTEFVCVFDDDTIPGNKWFENCLTTMEQVNGLLGTIGLIFKPHPERYMNSYYRVGWSDPVDSITKVDLVGHSWFFRKRWLTELFKILPDYDRFLVSGEDMGFSWALQKIGISTYVPPHPSNDLEMFGSIPSFAYNYGTENVGISMSTNGIQKFEDMFQYYTNEGFKFLNTP
jgi:hypothetical protein